MAKTIGMNVFDTAIGACGVAWSEDGIAGVMLPGSSAAAALAKLRQRHPDAREATPPAAVQEAIALIGRLLKGEPTNLSTIVLDMEGVADLNQAIYAITRRIEPGATRTYGEIAKEMGDPLLARAVGQAMGSNPFPIVVPCHRVLAAGGKTGGFSAPGGVDTKFRILQIEQAQNRDPNSLFDSLPLAIKPRGSEQR